MLCIFAMYASVKWTIITAAITTVSVLLAPNDIGNNIFVHRPIINNRLPLVFNTIIFVAFVVVDFLLPTELWIKLVIIVVVLAIHPVIDWLEGECVIISDVTIEAFEKIKEAKNH